jgi:FkbM family methyltransferase
MNEQTSNPTIHEQAILSYLRKISLRLDEMAALQRLEILGEARIFEFLHKDQMVRLFLPFAASDLIQHHILKSRNFFEARLLDRFRHYIPGQAIIIDAGANIGNHSVYFSKFCGAKKIYSFEPMRETFKILLRNVELNAPETIHCFNVALGASAGMADLLRYGAGNTGATRLKIDESGLYPVQTIDSFKLERLDVIKIDVEGAQISVLEGDTDTLARCKPIIWVELLRDDAQEGHEKLLSLGYERVEVLSGTDFVYMKH